MCASGRMGGGTFCPNRVTAIWAVGIIRGTAMGWYPGRLHCSQHSEHDGPQSSHSFASTGSICSPAACSRRMWSATFGLLNGNSDWLRSTSQHSVSSAWLPVKKWRISTDVREKVVVVSPASIGCQWAGDGLVTIVLHPPHLPFGFKPGAGEAVNRSQKRMARWSGHWIQPHHACTWSTESQRKSLPAG